MNTEPTVSVCMITYNHRPYIAEAVESVLRQETERSFELVIGEDCSTDGARDLVFEYQRKYPGIVRVVTADRNVGMTANGTRTIQACRGKYIAFCEGDDYWHRRDKLELQVTYMEAHPECGLVHSEFDLYDQDSGQTIEKYHRHRGAKPSEAEFLRILKGECPIRTCTVLAKRDLLVKTKLSDPVLHASGRFLMGDTQLWAELSQVAKIGYIDQSLATYRKLRNSASRNANAAAHLRFEASVHDMRLYLLDKYRIVGPLRDQWQRDLWRCRLRLAFHQNDSELGRQARRMLGSLSPAQWILVWARRTSWSIEL